MQVAAAINIIIILRVPDNNNCYETADRMGRHYNNIIIIVTCYPLYTYSTLP